MVNSQDLPDCIYQSKPSLICPITTTPNHTIYLSNLDNQKFLRFSIKYLYVFKKSVKTESLKESLSRVLVHYYPLAGRLRRTKENDDQKLEIDCNGQGALFTEAEMDLSVAEFLEFVDTPNKTFRKLLYRVEGLGFLDTPPLIVQVTHLKCGGMILCTAINHCFCDGIGTSQFLHAWAYATTQIDDCADLPISPIHSRHILELRNPPQVLYPHPGFTKTTPHENHSQSTPNIHKFLQSQTLVPISITFSSSHLLHLKRQCFPTVKCTTFEVLASHTWRCWVKSLGLPPSIQVKLLFSVDARKKLSADMMKGYYGNGFVLACAEAKVEELVAPNLHNGVKVIKHAKSTITGDYVKSVIDLLEDKRVRTDLDTTFVISQWSRLGLENVDFGEGTPVHMGPLTSDIYCLFLPVNGEINNVRVMLSMPESRVDKFKFYMREFPEIMEKNDTKICDAINSFEMILV